MLLGTQFCLRFHWRTLPVTVAFVFITILHFGCYISRYTLLALQPLCRIPFWYAFPLTPVTRPCICSCCVDYWLRCLLFVTLPLFFHTHCSTHTASLPFGWVCTTHFSAVHLRITFTCRSYYRPHTDSTTFVVAHGCCVYQRYYLRCVSVVLHIALPRCAADCICVLDVLRFGYNAQHEHRLNVARWIFWLPRSTLTTYGLDVGFMGPLFWFRHSAHTFFTQHYTPWHIPVVADFPTVMDCVPQCLHVLSTFIYTGDSEQFALLDSVWISRYSYCSLFFC